MSVDLTEAERSFFDAEEPGDHLAPFRHHFGPHPGGRGWQGRIPAGRFEVSVIAGGYFYSTPRTDKVADPLNYTAYEIAIFRKSGVVGTEWVTRLRPILGKELADLFDGDETSETLVAGCVSVADIAHILWRLNRWKTTLEQLAALAPEDEQLAEADE